MAGPVAFVGRDDELSRLLGALGGGAPMVLVVGDAGVGKSRLAEEGMTRAAAAGMVMVRGECLPLAGTVPLLPVAAALKELAGLDGGSVLAAALDAAPGFVLGEVGRLLPQLASGGGLGPGGPGGGWRRGRLFAGIAELFAVVAGGSGTGVGVVVEDVHWADSATLDCLTFVGRAGRRDGVTVVVTCREDATPLAAHVADWMAQVRGASGVEEIALGPLSRAEVAAQAAALAGRPVLSEIVDELYARAEGNPFFTEQLMAAVLASPARSTARPPIGLPRRLAEVLAAQTARCAGEAQLVLAALAVAARPLAEDLLRPISGLDAEQLRRGLRELAAARLLAEDTAGGAHRPRHALLAEAVAGRLLPGERAELHERTAQVLTAAGDQALAAEAAQHWQAAGRPADELSARMAAAEAAERVFGYAEAAGHRQRAIELCQVPGSAAAAGIDLPQLYVRAIDDLEMSGDGVHAGAVAEDAYRRFADHPDAATAAVVHHRAAYFRAIEAPAAGLPLIKETLRLFGQSPPSAAQAEAWHDYGHIFLESYGGQLEGSAPALKRALKIAEAAGATALIPRILASIAGNAFLRGQVEEGFARLERGWALARAAGDGPALLQLAVVDSYALLTLAQFENAADVALQGLGITRQTGLEGWFLAAILAASAAEALLARGRTADAAAVIDPMTAGLPDRDHWLVHEARAVIDLLRGDVGAAARRRQQIDVLAADLGHIDTVREVAQHAAELALWTGHPGDALKDTQRVLALLEATDLTIFCGPLLAAGMRACADLAEQSRARRDDDAASAALDAAAGLSERLDRMAGAPFADHPFVATIPAHRADWDAERTRLAGASEPAAWSSAAQTWDNFGCPHRAGYARWRQAQAQLDAGQPGAAAAAALQAAAVAADGHAPLLSQVRMLAERTRIPLRPPEAAPGTSPSAEASAAYGLTNRELVVLRLLAAGRTNAQIGAELYISPKTASVHVTSILRKLGVSGRVQVAALAERAGLLRPAP
jgi:DNA-binding CsgD family transcriptional regulator